MKYYTKVFIAFAVITVSALVMNLTLFKWRSVLFPLILLALPHILDRNFRWNNFIRVELEGIKPFLLISATTIVLYPPLFFGWFLWFEKASFQIPQTSALISNFFYGLFLGIVVAVPEELFFRAWLQETIFKKYNNKIFFIITKKNLTTSFIFGTAHAVSFLNPLRMSTFFPSLLFGWFTEKSRSNIFYAVLFHAVSNIIALELNLFIR